MRIFATAATVGGLVARRTGSSVTCAGDWGSFSDPSGGPRSRADRSPAARRTGGPVVPKALRSSRPGLAIATGRAAPDLPVAQMPAKKIRRVVAVGVGKLPRCAYPVVGTPFIISRNHFWFFPWVAVWGCEVERFYEAVGKALRRARRARGLTLRDVEERTRSRPAWP